MKFLRSLILPVSHKYRELSEEVLSDISEREGPVGYFLVRNQSIHIGILSSKCKSSRSSVLVCSTAQRTVYFALAAQALSHFPQPLPFFTYLPFLCKGVGACSLFCSVSSSEIRHMNRNQHTQVLTVTVMRVSVGSCWKALTFGTS